MVIGVSQSFPFYRKSNDGVSCGRYSLHMKRSIHLNAVTRADRNSLVSGISDAVADAGGWIEDVNFFSNISIVLSFVISAGSGLSLVKLLESQPMRLGSDDLAKLSALSARNKIEEVACTLQITFFHNDPDLHRHVPSVPG